MKLTDRQQQFPIPWANVPESGTLSAIPKDDPGDGSASLAKGFPKATMTPIAAGGKPPRGDQFNGILNQLSLCAQNNDVGVIPPWNREFAQIIGGYPKTSQITIIENDSPDILVSICDNNLDNPNEPHSENWVSIKAALQTKGDYAPASAGVPIGAIMMVSSYNIPDGWLQLAGQTFDQTQYPDLYAFMGTNVLPDYRGRFPRGAKGNWINVPEIGTYQADAIRNITGGTSEGSQRGWLGNGYVLQGTGYGCIDVYQSSNPNKNGLAGDNAANWFYWRFDASKSVPTDWENRPLSVISNFIIKAK